MAQILIADDSFVVRESLKKMLANSGHVVVAEATNGEEACTKYQLHKPDLVTLDINMPGMNGIDTVKKIISEYPEARIVMISTLGFQDFVFQALKAGAKHYIIKPFDEEKFSSVIDVVLSDSSL